MDFAAWMKVWLGDRWWTFDPRTNRRGEGRIVIGRGRHASEMAMVTTSAHQYWSQCPRAPRRTAIATAHPTVGTTPVQAIMPDRTCPSRQSLPGFNHRLVSLHDGRVEYPAQRVDTWPAPTRYRQQRLDQLPLLIGQDTGVQQAVVIPAIFSCCHRPRFWQG
jgi:hypothetical protein